MTEQGERAGELADELALPAGEEVVEHAIGQPPHELLVLLEALRRDQPHQQRAVVGVLGRVERDDLVAHRQLVAVLLDQLADVVALERDRESGERPSHRGARREGLGVAEDRDRLVVTGHHHHVVVRFAPHRTLAAQRLHVRVGILDELLVAEEVRRLDVGHRTCTSRREPC